MIPMSTPTPTPSAGEIVTATISGRPVELTVSRVSHGILYTDDWRMWWCGQEGHEDGENVHGTGDRVHLHGYTPHLSLVTEAAA